MFLVLMGTPPIYEGWSTATTKDYEGWSTATNEQELSKPNLIQQIGSNAGASQWWSMHHCRLQPASGFMCPSAILLKTVCFILIQSNVM